MEIINEQDNFQSRETDPMRMRVENIRENGFRVEIGRYLSEAMEIFKQDIGSFIGFTLVYLAVSVLLVFVPVLGAIVSILISPALGVGFFVVARKIDKGEEYGFNNFFDGFQKIIPLFLGGLISSVLIAIASIFLLIPGIYLGVAYLFVGLFIWFGEDDFWESMEYSRKLVTKQWFSLFAFVIVLVLINIGGFIALGVGTLVTIPISSIATYVAYKYIVGIDD